MPKWILCFILSLLWSFSALSDTEIFLQKHNLWKEYTQKIAMYNNHSDSQDKSNQFVEFIEQIIHSPLNETYKKALVEHLLKKFPHIQYDNSPIIKDYAVRYDPFGYIAYLSNLPNPSCPQIFQLLVLWHIYQPDIIQNDSYQNTAKKAHQFVLDYFKAKKWQSSWREEEYLTLVKNNDLSCYQDLNCLLNILPYWMDWEESFDVYIPCETAQKYNKVAYIDTAGGGHGSQSLFTSDCHLYDKYIYDTELEEYMNLLFRESIPEADGSMSYALYAIATYEDFIKKYHPKFNLPSQPDWAIFPYTEWAIQSYYNFNKFNSVLNSGIGYKKAVQKLTEHYLKHFEITHQQAYNTALYTLQPPSSTHWQRIEPAHLHYMLLSGKKWEDIEKTHPNISQYHQLLQFSIAYPDNLKKIIKNGQKESTFNIDFPNEFGKTPLMLATQYGYLESVKLLIQNGAKINKQTNSDEPCSQSLFSLCIYNSQRSALMYALQEGQYEIAKYLLEHHADTNLKDSKGMTAYQYMTGEAPYYNPHKISTINGGLVREESSDNKNQNLFTIKQVQELTPLLINK